MAQYPRRVLAQEWVKPSKSTLPCPPTDGSRLGGLVTALNAVFAGCLGRRKRANRCGKTAITRRASASSSQPRRQSSAQRVRKPRPFRRGCTSWTHHASKTRCRHTCATMGESTPPCGVPVSGEGKAPDASPPAWRHLPRRLTMPPSLPLCWRNSRRGPQARWAKHPRTAASTLQAMGHVRHCSRSSWSAWG